MEEEIPGGRLHGAASRSTTTLHENVCPTEWSGARLMMFTNQALLGYGVRSLILSELAAKVTLASGPAGSLESAVLAHQPDILLVDLTPEVGITILARIRSVRPESRIIVMASAVSSEMAYQLKSIGVVGILKRKCTLQECVAAFSQAFSGACRMEEPEEEGADAGEIVRLSPREGQLVMLLSQGLKNKEIAQCLGISEGTIRVYLSKLFLKIGANDRFELALFGLRNIANLPAFWPDGLDMDGDAGAARTIPSLRSLWLRRSRRRLVAGMAAAAGGGTV